MHTYNQRRRDRGFTLVELLIVIVILGVLATITVFAVRGITDQGEESACAAEWKNLETAQEANMAQRGEYVTEAELVSEGLLRSESATVDITLVGNSYTLSYVGTCAGQGATTTAGGGGGGNGTTVGTFAGLPATFYGTGPTDIVVIGYGPGVGLSVTSFNVFVADYEPIAGVRLVLLDDSGQAEIDTATIFAIVNATDRVLWAAGTDTISDDPDLAPNQFGNGLGGINSLMFFNPLDFQFLLDNPMGYDLTPKP